MIRLVIALTVMGSCTAAGLLAQSDQDPFYVAPFADTATSVRSASPRKTAPSPGWSLLPEKRSVEQNPTSVARRESKQTESTTDFTATSLLQIDSPLHGVVRPSLSAELPSLVVGLIVDVNVQEGQFVKKGTPLVVLDDRVPKAQLEVATVQANLTESLKRAQVDLKMAQGRLDRISQILNQGAGGEFERMEAEGIRDQANASVGQQQDVLKAAEATRKLAEAQLHQYTIVAPFDGVITKVHRKAGAVDPTLTLISIANLSSLEVDMHVPLRLFGQVKKGANITLQAARPISRTLKARILSVSPILDSASETFRCLIQIDNRNGDLPAGFTVTLQSQNNKGRISRLTR